MGFETLWNSNALKCLLWWRILNDVTWWDVILKHLHRYFKAWVGIRPDFYIKFGRRTKTVCDVRTASPAVERSATSTSSQAADTESETQCATLSQVAKKNVRKLARKLLFEFKTENVQVACTTNEMWLQHTISIILAPIFLNSTVTVWLWIESMLDVIFICFEVKEKTTVMKKDSNRLLHASARRLRRPKTQSHDVKQKSIRRMEKCCARSSEFVSFCRVSIYAFIYFSQYTHSRTENISLCCCRCCRPDSVGTTQNPTTSTREREP